MKTITSICDVKSYSSSYSESGLWNKLANFAKRLGYRPTWYALVLYYTLQSKEVSLKNKAIIIASLGYLIAPVDLIPDVVPVLGVTDDVEALILAYNTVRSSITPDIENQANKKIQQWFGY